MDAERLFASIWTQQRPVKREVCEHNWSSYANRVPCSLHLHRRSQMDFREPALQSLAYPFWQLEAEEFICIASSMQTIYPFPKCSLELNKAGM